MKAVLVSSLAAGLMFGAIVAPAAPAAAQDNLTGRVLSEICLPYTTQSQSFEKAMRTARDMKFRRPADERGEAMEESASEVNLVSRDGTWRLRLEEGTDESNDSNAYYLSCALSSTRASANELTDLGRRAFSDDRYWTADQSSPRLWHRRERHPEEQRLEARVVEEDGERPALTMRGLYF